jgi:hypothetical protein
VFPGRSLFAARILLSAALLIAFPSFSRAQRRAGGGINGTPSGVSLPSGIEETDSLKDFHASMAVAATGAQTVAFQALVKSTDAAKAALQAFLHGQGRQNSAAQSSADPIQLRQALDQARSGNKKFVDGLSDKQKLGLKEITRRLDRADSDLEQEAKKLDPATVAGSASGSALADTGLEKALAEFSDEQLALGHEMGIVLASGQDQTFTLPTLKTPVSTGNQTVSVPISGELTQVSAEGDRRTFRLLQIAALSDLQRSITIILRAQFAPSPCGERLDVRQANLTPASPASLLQLDLHYERWACHGGPGMAFELAEAEGSVVLKLTPAVDASHALTLTAEFERIDASGMMGESLRSGDLGDELREKVSQSMLAALRGATDFKLTLPPAVQRSMILQSARFQDTEADLNLALEGQVQLSNDQANLLATQLNQTLSAEQTTVPPPPAASH